MNDGRTLERGHPLSSPCETVFKVMTTFLTLKNAKRACGDNYFSFSKQCLNFIFIIDYYCYYSLNLY